MNIEDLITTRNYKKLTAISWLACSLMYGAGTGKYLSEDDSSLGGLGGALTLASLGLSGLYYRDYRKVNKKLASLEEGK